MLVEEKFISMRDGKKVYAHIKEIGSSSWIIALHGLGEHLGRHTYFSKLFGSDFNILRFDLRGHGRTQGARGDIDDFFIFMRDLEDVITFLKSNYHMKKYALFGHSMGALVAAGFMQQFCSQSDYPQLVVLSSPPVALPGVLARILHWSSPTLALKLASLPISIPLGGLIDLRKLSHDNRVYQEYINDELNILRPKSRLLFNMVNAVNKIFTRPLRLKCPAYCISGDKDQIIDHAALVNYFNYVERGVQHKIIKGAYHELHNEIPKFQTEYFAFLREIFIQSLLVPVGG